MNLNTLNDFPHYLRAGYKMLSARYKANPQTKSSHLVPKPHVSMVPHVQEILHTIINENYQANSTQKYFRPGFNHFHDFYIRDFGWVVEHLVALGYTTEVTQTLSFCLDAYTRNNRVSTCITQEKKTYDFSAFAIDSLAFLVYSLKVANYPISQLDRDFLEKQILELNTLFVHDGWRVKEHIFFSSMSDHKVKNSSLYDHCMLFLLSQNIDQLNAKCSFDTPLFNPFHQEKLLKKIESYWNGKYYFDDVDALPYFAAESQIIPFWTHATQDQHRLESIVKEFQSRNLASGVGVCYHEKEIFFESRASKPKFSPFALFSRDYQTYHAWTNLGILYLDVLYAHRQSKSISEEFQSQLDFYGKKICEDENLYEVYDFESRKPYQSVFYTSEQKMLWGATILNYISEWKEKYTQSNCQMK